MRRLQPGRALPLLALLAAFAAGMLVDWSLHTYGPPQPSRSIGGDIRGDTELRLDVERTRPLDGSPSHSKGTEEAALTKMEVVATSMDGPLRVPIDDVTIESLKGGFAEGRREHAHEAVDILAPRNTPVHAVERGTIAKLFVSRQGGNTIYQFDPSGRFCYYYAHLERYADGLHEGDAVSQGDVLGYVGSSGNAPPNTPHLHFAVFELTDAHQWWKGHALDPYEVFKGRG